MILERFAEARSRVLPLWSDFPVVLLGGGPSLTPEHFETVRRAREADAVRVIAINDSYLSAPWADVCYAADSKWLEWHRLGVAKPKLGLNAAQVRERWASFQGQKCGIHTAEPYHPKDMHVLRLMNLPRVYLSRDPTGVASGRHDGYTGHGGFQALNVATLAGAKTIILLGYDGGPAANGKTHHHGEHEIQTPPVVWEHIRRSFSVIENELKADGVRVFNCSLDSAIGSFPKVDLRDALGFDAEKAA